MIPTEFPNTDTVSGIKNLDARFKRQPLPTFENNLLYFFLGFAAGLLLLLLKVATMTDAN